MKSIAFHNLGCKVNSYEMDVMQQMLQKSGYEIVEFEQISDIYVINTCSVTNMADRKSRQMIHKAKKQNPDAVVVAVGCYVQTDTKGVAEDESVDLMIGNNHKGEIIDILNRYFAENKREETNESPMERKTLHGSTMSDLLKADYEETMMTHTGEHTRAYIKIQDGCNRYCSYCVIPYARGRVRSRVPENILEEISELVKEGYQEFVLTGIHVSSYGLDIVGTENSDFLLRLLERVGQITGVERIRLGSLEPMIITPEFAEGLTRVQGLCPHFHLSLQSGNDETLKRMNRRYTSGEYSKRVQILRDYFPNAAITTDVIVGFPGETEEEFEITKRFLKEIDFYEMHIFKYSKRSKTKAAVMPNQVPDEVKTQRSEQLLQLEREQSERFRESFLGIERPVLFEERKEIDGCFYWLGYTPEYVRVAFRSEENLSNRIIYGASASMLNPDTLLLT